MSNVTELNQLIQDYPLLLSYSLDTSVSRLDFLIEVQYGTTVLSVGDILSSSSPYYNVFVLIVLFVSFTTAIPIDS